MELHSVYELIDPRDSEPFYVGCSRVPEGRYLGHLDDININPVKEAHIKSIINAGLKPRLNIIEQWEDRSYAEEREVYWIHEYLRRGFILTNSKYRFNKVKRQVAPAGSRKRIFIDSLDQEWNTWRREEKHFPLVLKLDIFIASYHLGGLKDKEEETFLEEWKREQLQVIGVLA